MDSATIILSSVTWAIRAQKLLERHGIRSYVKKESSGSRGGCAYSLEIRRNADVAIDYLTAANIRIMEILL